MRINDSYPNYIGALITPHNGRSWGMGGSLKKYFHLDWKVSNMHPIPQSKEMYLPSCPTFPIPGKEMIQRKQTLFE